MLFLEGTTTRCVGLEDLEDWSLTLNRQFSTHTWVIYMLSGRGLSSPPGV